MTIEKFNEIKEHLEELMNAVIQVRDVSQDYPITRKCKISKKPIMVVRVIEEDSIKQTTTPKNITKYCLLEEINGSEHTDIKFNRHRFGLEKVYNAFKNNDSVIYNPHKKCIIKKR